MSKTLTCVQLIFLASKMIDHLDHLALTKAKEAWPIIQGPIVRTGATAKINSVYVRDPDQNLIEISELLS